MRERDGSAVTIHGYAGYSNGCRCQTCRRAKAQYMARRRGEAIRNPELIITDPAVTHGTRSTYEERGCRCGECVAAGTRARRTGSMAGAA